MGGDVVLCPRCYHPRAVPGFVMEDDVRALCDDPFHTAKTFHDVPVGARFWLRIGGEWFASVKVNASHAQSETPDGLKYGQPIPICEDREVKLEV